MKALTLYQPWATLIAISAKRIETRSWSTNYRGPLAIHAGKCRDYIYDQSFLFICNSIPFEQVLTQAGYDLKWLSMPRGAIVATCDLVDCQRTDEYKILPNSHEVKINNIWRRWEITDQEVAFGNYVPGRCMWFLDNIKILNEPIPAKGAMGLWEWQEPV